MDNEYTVGEAAAILGVTPRTLRHWDDIGVLSPSRRTLTDYRLYTEDDLELGMVVMVYRGAGLELKDIAALLDEPSTAMQRLARQREVLMRRARSLTKQISALDAIIAAQEQGKELTVSEKIDHFGKDYHKEAEHRWGDTPEWAQSQQAQANMRAGDWADVKREQEELIVALAKAKAAGVQPGSDRAQELVEQHRKSIARFYEVTPDKQLILARMYVEDPRFEKTYRGTAHYLLELVEHRAQQQGVDLNNPQW